jgi:hypothetical protein
MSYDHAAEYAQKAMAEEQRRFTVGQMNTTSQGWSPPPSPPQGELDTAFLRLSETQRATRDLTERLTEQLQNVLREPGPCQEAAETATAPTCIMGRVLAQFDAEVAHTNSLLRALLNRLAL